MPHAAMTWIVPAVVAIIGILGSFLVAWGASRYKLRRFERDLSELKEELKSQEHRNKRRIYNEDGTTIYMPRNDCDRNHTKQERDFRSAIKALTAEIKALQGLAPTLAELAVRLDQIEKNQRTRDREILNALKRFNPTAGPLQAGTV